MENTIKEILSHLCDAIPEGCTLVMKTGRVMLIDDDFQIVKGTVFVTREITGQASEQQLAYFKEL